MNTRPGFLGKIIAGISLILSSNIALADSSYFSFSFNYSNYGHYVHPYRYVYAPAYYYAVPSPFYFGYTSYYCPVFPYYYTPVVYYRPVLPYYYPYAYNPYWVTHYHYYAYRSIYPTYYMNGYYPYSRYYSYYPYKYYNYQPAYYHDHFHGYNKTQRVGTTVNNTVINKQIVKQQNNINNQKIIISNSTIDAQRKREIDNYRKSFQSNSQVSASVSGINKYYNYKDDAISNRNLTQNENNKTNQWSKDDRDSSDNKYLSSNEKTNLDRIDHLLNKNTGQVANSNRRIQINEDLSYHKKYSVREETGNNAEISSDAKTRQSNNQNTTYRSNKIYGNNFVNRETSDRHAGKPELQFRNRQNNPTNNRISATEERTDNPGYAQRKNSYSQDNGPDQERSSKISRRRASEGERFGGMRNERNNIAYEKMRFEARGNMGFRR